MYQCPIRISEWNLEPLIDLLKVCSMPRAVTTFKKDFELCDGVRSRDDQLPDGTRWRPSSRPSSRRRGWMLCALLWNLRMIHTIFAWHVCHGQCDQIGPFVKVLGNQFYYKRSQNIWVSVSLGYFEKHNFEVKTAVATIWTTLRNTWATFYSYILSTLPT